MQIIHEIYHGTAKGNIDSIKETGFKESEGEEHFFADGAYFFMGGISNPLKDAEKWAIAEAWDNISKSYCYTEYAVIKVTIEFTENKKLDFRKEDDIKKLYYAKDELVKKMTMGKKTVKGKILDGHVINYLRNDLGFQFDIIIGNVYIKFSNERINKFESKIPNVTIISVNNCDNYIKDGEIEIVEEGTINELR